MNIFAFGFGQVSKYFIKKLAKEKNNFELNISSRKDSHSGLFEGIKFNSYQFDVKKIDNRIFEAILKADYILISIPPIDGQDIVIKNFKEAIKKTKTKWITYLSATSVYGNHNGEWVNEKSKTKPTTINGVNRLKAEDQWLEFSKQYNLPFQIFRLSGIYSNQNNILKRLRAGQTKIVKKENHFFSRIHVEDISNILFKSLKTFKRNEIFNISDDKPASQIDVAIYGSKLLKIVSPEPLKLDSLEDGMLKDFYKDSKKVDNKKMKEFFNYKLIYPTYKEGLDHIFNNKI
jgi:nucleoside-diphosphate-sugar epimerase